MHVNIEITSIINKSTQTFWRLIAGVALRINPIYYDCENAQYHVSYTG